MHIADRRRGKIQFSWGFSVAQPPSCTHPTPTQIPGFDHVEYAPSYILLASSFKIKIQDHFIFLDVLIPDVGPAL